jgi:hypothetical protein
MRGALLEMLLVLRDAEKKMRQVGGGRGMGILCEGIEIIKYYSIFKFLVCVMKNTRTLGEVGSCWAFHFPHVFSKLELAFIYNEFIMNAQFHSIMAAEWLNE